MEKYIHRTHFGKKLPWQRFVNTGKVSYPSVTVLYSRMRYCQKSIGQFLQRDKYVSWNLLKVKKNISIAPTLCFQFQTVSLECLRKNSVLELLDSRYLIRFLMFQKSNFSEKLILYMRQGCGFYSKVSVQRPWENIVFELLGRPRVLSSICNISKVTFLGKN